MKYTIELPKQKVSRFAAKQPAPGLISNIWTIYPGNKNSSLLHDEATFWCWG
jgi:hypothetical protein